MTMTFTDEEYEWIVFEPANWHIRDGCPEEIRKRIQRKFDELGVKDTRGLKLRIDD